MCIIITFSVKFARPIERVVKSWCASTTLRRSGLSLAPPILGRCGGEFHLRHETRQVCEYLFPVTCGKA
uniref:Uncharacterized protein n=1 Tax=Anguilla anguilla TaxID=7936 RepID=A0A0E9RKY8_ANGAN